MACCIFAAMIISNVLVHWRRLKAFFGYQTGENPGVVSVEGVARKNMSLRYRLRRGALPALLILGTVGYGAMHWQHMSHELGLGKPQVVAAATPIDAAFFQGAYDFICN
ncbi:hypothetical protein I6N98_13245 [Spongiibacter nanhainus]|uniref:Uncharacterized protein n=1 Tax=Spongiibacter nanhainus TaxID=2794344 RepID=A0A7T4QYV5_9GAMM|nr:hypothetical protein [Spongiibacter nanhainus]QQD17325.1 hypothetical protein I6N98_13245 [Spongiibacter nanhainus]